MSIIRVRARGQITLPREVRKAVRLGAGDYLACEVQGDTIVLRKATACPHTKFEDGIWRVVGSAEDREGKNDVSADKHKYLWEIHKGDPTPSEKPFVRLYGAMKGETSLVRALAEERGRKTRSEPEQPLA